MTTNTNNETTSAADASLPLSIDKNDEQHKKRSSDERRSKRRSPEHPSSSSLSRKPSRRKSRDGSSPSLSIGRRISNDGEIQELSAKAKQADVDGEPRDRKSRNARPSRRRSTSRDSVDDLDGSSRHKGSQHSTKERRSRGGPRASRSRRRSTSRDSIEDHEIPKTREKNQPSLLLSRDDEVDLNDNGEKNNNGDRRTRSSSHGSRGSRNSRDSHGSRDRNKTGSSGAGKRTSKRPGGIAVGIVTGQEEKDREAKRRARRGSNDGTPGAISSSNRSSGSDQRRSDRDAKRKAGRKSRAVAPGAVAANDYNSSDDEDFDSSRRSGNGDEKHKYRRSRRTSAPVVPGATPERSSGSRESRRRLKEQRAAKRNALQGVDEAEIAVRDGANNRSETIETVPEAMVVEENDDDHERPPKKEFAVQGNAVMPPPEQSNTMPITSHETAPTTTPKKKPFYAKINFWILVVMILGGAGAAFYFITQNNNNTEGVPGVPAPATTDEDTSLVPTTPTSTSSPTGLSSSAPTGVLEIQPPSPEDCLAVSKGEPVEVRQDLIQNLRLPMDVLLDAEEEGVDQDAVAAELQQKMQEFLAPELLECNNIERRGRRMRGAGGSMSDGRNLLTSKYLIGNAEVTVTPNQEACTATDQEPCLHMLVFITVYLKETERPIYVQAFIQQVFGGEGELMNKLDLPSPPYQALFVSFVENLETTLAPSDVPSASPSIALTPSPSSTPSTAVPSSNPTVAPAIGPTTPEPTIPPSLAPTGTPSSSLVLTTPAPTPPPTPGPTPPPTPPPTPGPTAAPAPGVTPNPTPPPTPPPTAMDSAQPSVAPSPAPTNAPTSGPTNAPTSGPTSAPTSGPTSGPTPVPTSGPTTPPTGSPSLAPVTPAPTETPEGNCGPLWGGSRCSGNYPHYYCNAAWGTCGDNWNFKNQGTAWDFEGAPDILGRCGPLFDGRVCDCGVHKYCNEFLGWCGDTTAHRDMQPNTHEYDCPAEYPPPIGDVFCRENDGHTYSYIKPLSNTNLCLKPSWPTAGFSLIMVPCDPNDTQQFWRWDHITKQIRLFGDVECIDPQGPSWLPETALQIWTCGETNILVQHQFELTVDWMFELAYWNPSANACIDLAESFPQLQTCDANDSGQKMALGTLHC